MNQPKQLIRPQSTSNTHIQFRTFHVKLTGIRWCPVNAPLQSRPPWVAHKLIRNRLYFVPWNLEVRRQAVFKRPSQKYSILRNVRRLLYSSIKVFTITKYTWICLTLLTGRQITWFNVSKLKKHYANNACESKMPTQHWHCKIRMQDWHFSEMKFCYLLKNGLTFAV